MKHVELIEQTMADLEHILKHMERPGGRVRAVELAAKNLRDWQATRTPPLNTSERGGTSSVTDREDAADERRLERAVAQDVKRLDDLALELGRRAAEIRRLVVRYTATVDAGKLPADVPGCRSCRRVNESWVPVYAKSVGSGLCRWCYDIVGDGGSLPPKHLVARHLEGRRLSSADVERARVGARKALTQRTTRV